MCLRSTLWAKLLCLGDIDVIRCLRSQQASLGSVWPFQWLTSIVPPFPLYLPPSLFPFPFPSLPSPHPSPSPLQHRPVGPGVHSISDDGWPTSLQGQKRVPHLPGNSAEGPPLPASFLGSCQGHCGQAARTFQFVWVPAAGKRVGAWKPETLHPKTHWYDTTGI